MLVKQPKVRYLAARKGLKVFFIVEGVLISFTYLLYAACNRSQTTRKYFNDRPYFKPILNFYYATGRICGSTAVEDYDRAVWEAQAKLEKVDKI